MSILISGLSAAKPKRFVVLDAGELDVFKLESSTISDMLYTESKLNSILEAKSCKVDEDCTFFDCTSKCNNATGQCGPRFNDNIDVFCQKLIGKLFGTYWSKSNRYLAACRKLNSYKWPDLNLNLDDTSGNSSKRLADLRLVWSWSLSDI
jgi:hypothetical protein